MAETILAILAIVVGLICLAFALLSAGANHMGGATASDQVDHKITVISVILAVGFIALGVWLF
ncbi:MAG: hypothetical protein ACOH2M_27085 [Cypionkella sp.]